MADFIDGRMGAGTYADVPAQLRRDVLAAMRWALRMSEVREDRAKTRELRQIHGWRPDLPLVPYAPRSRRKT
jgi:hypothetical protein